MAAFDTFSRRVTVFHKVQIKGNDLISWTSLIDWGVGVSLFLSLKVATTTTNIRTEQS